MKSWFFLSEPAFFEIFEKEHHSRVEIGVDNNGVLKI